MAGTPVKLGEGNIMEFDIVEVTDTYFTGFEIKKTDLSRIEWSKVDLLWLEKEQPDLYKRYFNAKRKVALEAAQSLTPVKSLNGVIIEFQVKEITDTHFLGFQANKTELSRVEWSKVDLTWLQKNQPVFYNKYIEAKKTASVASAKSPRTSTSSAYSRVKQILLEYKIHNASLFKVLETGAPSEVTTTAYQAPNLIPVIQMIEGMPEFKTDGHLKKVHANLKTIVEFSPKLIDAKSIRVYDKKSNTYLTKVNYSINSEARFKLSFAFNSLDKDIVSIDESQK